MAKDDLQDKLLKELVETTKDSNKSVHKLQEDMTYHQKDYALHQQKTENAINGLRAEMIEYNAELKKHSARSDRLEQDNLLREKKLRAEVFGEGIQDPEKRKHTMHGRISAIEFIVKWFKVSWVVVIAILGLVSKLMGLW